MAGGRSTFATCAACHGSDGAGGIGPALTAVRETFPDCETHIRWIRLGSKRWSEEVGPTYGAADTVIEGTPMPSFDSLSDVEIRRIAMYERVRFGGGELESERTACGLG